MGRSQKGREVSGNRGIYTYDTRGIAILYHRKRKGIYIFICIKTNATGAYVLCAPDNIAHWAISYMQKAKSTKTNYFVMNILILGYFSW